MRRRTLLLGGAGAALGALGTAAALKGCDNDEPSTVPPASPDPTQPPEQHYVEDYAVQIIVVATGKPTDAQLAEVKAIQDSIQTELNAAIHQQIRFTERLIGLSASEALPPKPKVTKTVTCTIKADGNMSWSAEPADTKAASVEDSKPTMVYTHAAALDAILQAVGVEHTVGKPTEIAMNPTSSPYFKAGVEAMKTFDTTYNLWAKKLDLGNPITGQYPFNPSQLGSPRYVWEFKNGALAISGSKIFFIPAGIQKTWQGNRAGYGLPTSLPTIVPNTDGRRVQQEFGGRVITADASPEVFQALCQDNNTCVLPPPSLTPSR